MAARIEKSAFHVPTLQELGQVLQGGLKKNFANVQVSVVDCPDLTQEPFTFAAAGICGKPRIADVGGVDYLLPLPQTEKIYNLNVIANQVELPGGFILGAGAASFKAMGVNAELMPNVLTKGDGKPEVNHSYSAKIDPATGGCVLEKYGETYKTCDCALLANLFISEGKPGKVIEVRSSRRTGQSNFVSCMRETLEQHYGDKSVGMGGTFLIQTGKAKLHVMPEFSPCPLNSNEAVNNWLKFFDMSAPLISQSVFVSRDLGFDLRLEHTHCFSHHGEGGHYHYDTTPDNVEYLGYFVPAEYLYRIDRPEKTLKIGRD
ncbi:ester hydrolase C11orf54 homolog isoform X1 [Chiloscyllium plagiosum]|uniref:ester hydrolase C11orf54 homolog isoform X1 n=2 Tax=Chiloscyllium plagiosum TaxID=36176 RepID=UPI001CB7DAB0|nr:ester hydrolase C11orf54 homolog isoform X1 [Chiloscyllium plagiosum]XP_043574524.1 ester hydrolase C11orf54 homolog isoform X1 [Chiloscyllium plagiosum]XP_043574525.1 ester hydrolase C11orf54 homolog isoform X1 [Chiloscyllium plagiosum]